MIFDFLKRLFGTKNDEYNRSENDGSKKETEKIKSWKEEALAKREYKTSERIVECESLNKIVEQYDDVCMFYCGLAKVERGGKAGFINMQGELVIDLMYDKEGTDEFCDGFTLVRKGDKQHIINTKNEIIVTTEYDDVWVYDEGIATAKVSKGEYVVYNLLKGSEKKISGIKNEIYFHYGAAYVEIDSMKGFIDRDANIFYQSDKCDDDTFFGEVAVINRYGGDNIIVDLKGNSITLEKGWRVCDDFYFGDSVVEINEKYGIIGKDGRIIVEAEYDSYKFIEFDDFKSNNIMMWTLVKDNVNYFFKKDGTIFAELEYSDDLEFNSNDKFITIHDGRKWLGVIDLEGNVRKKSVKCKFVELIGEDFVLIHDKECRTIMDLDENIVFQAEIGLKDFFACEKGLILWDNAEFTKFFRYGDE